MATPLELLNEHRERRESAVEALTVAHDELVASCAKYREAWKGAVSAGWKGSELERVKFVKPARLPRLKAFRAREDEVVDEAYMSGEG